MYSMNLSARLVAGVLCATVLSASTLTARVAADEIPMLSPPKGEVVLTVSGAINRRNSGDSAVFDMAMLESLGTTTLRTSTPWTDGTQEFTGVLMRDVLRAVDARGVTVSAVARNNYSQRIPADDFDKYPVLLAFAMNGVPLKLRDKGPLWIIYPRDQFPELATLLIERRSVWQLAAVVVE